MAAGKKNRGRNTAQTKEIKIERVREKKRIHRYGREDTRRGGRIEGRMKKIMIWHARTREERKHGI